MDAGGLDVFHDAADHHRTVAVAEGVHIHLNGVVEILINQHGMVGFHLHRLGHVTVEFGFVVDHFHGAAAEHIAGAHDHRIAHPIGHGPGFGIAAGQAVARLANLQPAQDRLKLFAVFGGIDRLGRGAPDPGAGHQPLGRAEPAQQGDRQFQRRLAAKLHDHPLGALHLDDVEHVFQGERFEVEPIAGVVVG